MHWKEKHCHLALVLLVSVSIVSFLASPGVGAAEEGGAASKRIRDIRIVRGNVFERAEADRYTIFRIAFAACHDP